MQSRSGGRSFWYSVRLVLFVVIGLVLGERASHWDVWIDARYRIFRLLQQALPGSPYVRETAVVLIGDDEYWRELRPYGTRGWGTFIADLLTALDAINPAVIVLDFDWRSPVPSSATSSTQSPPLNNEVGALTAAIEHVSRQRSIVLPQTIERDEDGQYILGRDVLGQIVFGDTGHIVRGYIALPKDMR